MIRSNPSSSFFIHPTKHTLSTACCSQGLMWQLSCVILSPVDSGCWRASLGCVCALPPCPAAFVSGLQSVALISHLSSCVGIFTCSLSWYRIDQPGPHTLAPFPHPDLGHGPFAYLHGPCARDSLTDTWSSWHHQQRQSKAEKWRESSCLGLANFLPWFMILGCELGYRAFGEPRLREICGARNYNTSSQLGLLLKNYQ
jgi:hypothetical protein